VKLLRLYPKAWRQRYEAEMRALLDQDEVTIATRLDLLRGALDASLFDRGFAMGPALPALRGARLGLVPCAFVLAHYLLSLDLHADSSLIHLSNNAVPASLAIVCLWPVSSAPSSPLPARCFGAYGSRGPPPRPEGTVVLGQARVHLRHFVV